MTLVAVTAVHAACVVMAGAAMASQAPEARGSIKDCQVEQKSCDEDRAGDYQHFGHGRSCLLIATPASIAAPVAIAVNAERLGEGPVQENVSVKAVTGPKHHQNHQDDEDDNSNRTEHVLSQPDEKSDA
jgi:hypothetical protein